MAMNMDDMLDIMDDMLEEAWHFPLTGKSAVDVKKLKSLVDDIRLNMPTEIRQAKAIVADRNEIIQGARKEAELIIQKAEDRAKALVANDEIVRAAKERADEIVSNAQARHRELKQGSLEFADNMLKETEAALTTSLQEVRKKRQLLKSPQKPSSEN